MNPEKMPDRNEEQMHLKVKYLSNITVWVSTYTFCYSVGMFIHLYRSFDGVLDKSPSKRRFGWVYSSNTCMLKQLFMQARDSTLVKPIFVMQ